MKIRFGGIVPVTLSDFPGRVAAAVFTMGCNFRCPFCHNGHLVDGGGPESDAQEVFSFLQRRRKLLGGVVVSGGEPCLHPGLPDFCGRLRAMGFAVKLDTNGSRPAMLERLFGEGVLDYVAMDVKAPAGRMSELAGTKVDEEAVLRSVALIAASGVAHHFRTTIAAPLVANDDIAAIRAMLPPGSRHVAQPFVRGNALDPALRGGGVHARVS